MISVRIDLFRSTVAVLLSTLWGLGLASSCARAQEVGTEARPVAETESDMPTAPEQQVDVDPLAADHEIEERLQRILMATERFEDTEIQVQEGVVFLSGSTSKEEFRTWAGDLASNTQDVVAVVNRIVVDEGPIWDLSPAWAEIRRLIRETVQVIPLMGLAILLLIATWFASSLAMNLAGWLLERRMSNKLLRQVATRAVAVPVFLMGLYLILRISGLTQMAATVLGGTGLIGLIVGIAFRDIAENFLASVLISIQRPFSIGDLIEVDGHHGFVQSVTTRGTLLMTLDGNHVQIPNATIYKAVIHNFTANPAIRLNFVVGIGYDDSVALAQEVALNVLHDHPIVLEDPEPLVLVDKLGAATVNLDVYFWINGHEHSAVKGRSSVIRLVKRSFEKSGISMPDEAREVVFPNGVPVDIPGENGRLADTRQAGSERAVAERNKRDDEVANEAEGNLASEAAEIHQQAEQSRRPDEGANLLANEEPSSAAAADQ